MLWIQACFCNLSCKNPNDIFADLESYYGYSEIINWQGSFRLPSGADRWLRTRDIFYGLFFSKLEKHICGNMSPEWIINTIYAQKKTNVWQAALQMTHPASTSNIKISNINLFMWHFASVIMHFLKNESVLKLSLAHKVSLYIFTFTLTEILFMTGANKGGRNGQRFQNKSLVFGGLFKEGITTRSGAISYTFFIVIF